MKDPTKYQLEMREKLFAAVLDAGKTDDPKVVMVKSGELSEELILLLAWAISTSEECATPSKARALTEEFAKEIRVRALEFRKMAEDGKMPNVSYVHERDFS